MTAKKILVAGATGKQGGAVVNALLKHPPPFEHKILALTRSVTSAKAKSLAANPNIELVTGDLGDCSTIWAQTGGKGSIWGVFSMTVPSMGKKENGVDLEELQGNSLIDAAVENDVEHFVYTSVDRGGPGVSDTNATPIAHFISKYNIENHLKAKAQGTSMTWTILRPVAFMDNLGPNMFGRMFAAMWEGVGDKPLQLVSTKDIGIFAAQAFGFADTDEFKNQAISLAGDELTQAQAAEVFWNALARPMPKAYSIMGTLLQTMVKEVGIMFKWFRDVGYGADIQQCRKLNAGMSDLAKYLKEESGFKR